ncbi:AAA family ATPase, partial [Vibrio parahaemolyticus]
PGVGKSLLGQQLATARWAGRPFLGLPSAAGPSLYVTAEDDPAELHRRQNG